MATDDLANLPSKVPIEQFDVTNFSKDKIRELFRLGKVPTAEAMVDELLLRAVKVRATDLHFEPSDAELRIRMGHEGVLKRLISLPREIADNLANVLKTKASLNAFEKKKPQEGRFSLMVGNHQFDIRISIVPVLAGERVALRFFEKNARVANIEELGFTPESLKKFRSLLHRPSGLILVTGPASSGKSTTVYAAVNDLRSMEKNIITVEDPIEYKLDFASQVHASSADKAFTFAEALRAILRQNPNVIMLGEIRDAETGIVAAEAALTGNLVLSTMLSGDTVGTILRLLNLGIPAYWLATTLIGVVNQVLVRRICETCREEYHPSGEQHSVFMNVLTGQNKFYRGKGCAECEGTGYRGRTAMHEILAINDQLRDLIYQQASILKLKEAARASGLETIFQDGIKKVTSGVTTISEFARAFG